MRLVRLYDCTYHELLTLLETPQERSQGTNIHGVGEDRHEVVQDTGDLAEQGTDPLGTLRNLNVEQLLNSQRETLLVGHHGDVVETIKVGQGLEVCLVLDQFLGTTVQQTDVGVCADNLFTIELENQTQDTVSGGMLRTEVDGVVADLALVGVLIGVIGEVDVRVISVAGTGNEVGVDGDEASGIGVVDGSGKVTGERGRQRAEGGRGARQSRALVESPGCNASK